MYEWIDPGPLDDPVLIVAFDGWVNAGEAGTRAAEVIADGGDIVAAFDSDALYDFRANRPTVTFVEGVMESVAWPSMDLVHVAHDGRDILVLAGVEPNWHWQQLATSIAELAHEIGVTQQISLGGIPWAAPHTRPVRTIVTSSDRARLDPADDHPEGRLQVPGAAVNIVAGEIAARGIPSTGFWARVPHYIGTTHHASALALLDRVSLHLGVALQTDELVAEADQQLGQLDAIADARPQVKALVEQLETLLDQQDEVSGEDLAAEIERFLRDRDDSNPA
jgi:predicted ATP-grasp superfamily ATP-dependent carboligase